MPIKIFAAPGDHRNDFEAVEIQVNEWIKQNKPDVRDIRCTVNAMPEKRNLGDFLLTVIVLYE